MSSARGRRLRVQQATESSQIKRRPVRNAQVEHVRIKEWGDAQQAVSQSGNIEHVPIELEGRRSWWTKLLWKLGIARTRRS